MTEKLKSKKTQSAKKQKELKIEYLPIGDIKPYENNPRKNDRAVEPLMESIKKFGFRVPIIIDVKNVIVTGHTRLKAAERLELEKVPCVRADDLTDEQIRAYRLADNKVGELAEWDYDSLDEELAKIVDIEMDALGFIINDESNFVNDLLENDYGTTSKGDNSHFAVTFTFEKQHEKKVLDYIRKVGKQSIIDYIIGQAGDSL